jgi:recombination protein RecR
MNDSIEQLAALFREFPGIGERQARRFVYFLLNRDKPYLTSLTNAISELKNKSRQCSLCFRFYTDDGHEFCDICGSSKRNKALLMVVEKDADITSVERSGAYKGLYFVFGGTVPIVEKDTERLVRIRELIARITQELKNGTLTEIILAFSLTASGDHTDVYVRKELYALTENTPARISSLGRGLSTGTELEYSDSETLKNALQNRH